jgi:starch phosphorylase
MEASGTSGMKAAVNGVPSLSVLDGWWIEGHIEGVTGWAIGASSAESEQIDQKHANALYHTLEKNVLPCFYADNDRFIEIMRQTIALNGSFYSSQRMMWQYLHNAYRIPSSLDTL